MHVPTSSSLLMPLSLKCPFLPLHYHHFFHPSRPSLDATSSRNPCLITRTKSDFFPLMPYGFPVSFALELLAGIRMIEPQGVGWRTLVNILANQRLCYASMLIPSVCDAWNCHNETIRDYTASPLKVAEGLAWVMVPAFGSILTYCLGLEWPHFLVIGFEYHQMEILFLFISPTIYSRHSKNIIWVICLTQITQDILSTYHIPHAS